jgi:uncharacterized protein YoxC
MDSWREWLTFGMGLSGFVGGAILWYRGSVEKQYASQRDFQHIRRNQEQIQQAAKLLADDLETTSHEVRSIYENTKDLEIKVSNINSNLTETKALVLAITNRMEGIAAKIDSSTSGFMYRKS